MSTPKKWNFTIFFKAATSTEVRHGRIQLQQNKLPWMDLQMQFSRPGKLIWFGKEKKKANLVLWRFMNLTAPLTRQNFSLNNAKASWTEKTHRKRIALLFI